MTDARRVCLIGQVLVDVTLPTPGEPYKLRAGGIMHAARALWAIGCEYSLLYCAPQYLEAQIREHAAKYGAAAAAQFGLVSGAPNVILIAEPTETGHQGYELLLREVHHCDVFTDRLNAALSSSDPTDILIFPGGFQLERVLPGVGATRARVHVDANFEPESSEDFALLNSLARSWEG